MPTRLFEMRSARIAFVVYTLIVILNLGTNGENLVESDLTVKFQCQKDPVVINNLDSGNGSLRAAISAACAGSTIRFDISRVESPIVLTSQLEVVKNLNIIGPGASRLSISGAGTVRVIHIENGNVSCLLSGLTIENGNARNLPGFTSGGGIWNSGGKLTLSGVSVENNMAENGGGIFSEPGKLIILDSAIVGNTADLKGGGGNGGGVYANGTDVLIINTTIAKNMATGTGGGIFVSSRPWTITNSTIAENVAPDTAGVLIDSQVTFANTIIARNIPSNSTPRYPDIEVTSNGRLLSNGNNLIGDTRGNHGWIASDLQNRNPEFDAKGLRNNGGDTKTLALQLSSPAVNGGNNALALDENGIQLITDQRKGSFRRIVGSVVDIGATESNPRPVVSHISPPTGKLFESGSIVTFLGKFTDNYDDEHTAEWRVAGTDGEYYIDGRIDALSRTVVGANQFDSPGVYTATLMVTDGSGQISVPPTRSNGGTPYFVVFEPHSGEVKGRDSFESPAGAFKASPNLTGIAKISLSAGYKRGSFVPRGNFQFTFKAADLTFKSDEFYWVVVNKNRVDVMGSGRLGKTEGNSFWVTVTDGQWFGVDRTDRIRIQIWKTEDGKVLYDNQSGSGPNTAPETALVKNKMRIKK